MLVIVSTIPTGVIGYAASDLVTMASQILFSSGHLPDRDKVFCSLLQTGYRPVIRGQRTSAIPMDLSLESVRELQLCRDFHVPEPRSRPA